MSYNIVLKITNLADMHKNALFYRKIAKNRTALGLLPQSPLPLAAVGFAPRPLIASGCTHTKILCFFNAVNYLA